MIEEGPDVDTLVHRLADCPPAFLRQPRVAGEGEVHVDAVVGDLMVDLGQRPLAERLECFREGDTNWLRLVLITAWLAHVNWFVCCTRFAPAILDFLQNGLHDLAAVVRADNFVTHPERREELARLLLHSLDLRPGGESESQAADRLVTVSTVAREKILAELREKRERAKKLREEMERKRAREAATRYSRE
jgi:hypothetical protein